MKLDDTLIRDIESKAVICTDSARLNQLKNSREASRKIQELESRVTGIEGSLNSIQTMLRILLEKHG